LTNSPPKAVATDAAALGAEEDAAAAEEDAAAAAAELRGEEAEDSQRGCTTATRTAARRRTLPISVGTKVPTIKTSPRTKTAWVVPIDGLAGAGVLF